MASKRAENLPAPLPFFLFSLFSHLHKERSAAPSHLLPMRNMMTRLHFFFSLGPDRSKVGTFLSSSLFFFPWKHAMTVSFSFCPSPTPAWLEADRPAPFSLLRLQWFRRGDRNPFSSLFFSNHDDDSGAFSLYSLDGRVEASSLLSLSPPLKRGAPPPFAFPISLSQTSNFPPGRALILVGEKPPPPPPLFPLFPNHNWCTLRAVVPLHSMVRPPVFSLSTRFGPSRRCAPSPPLFSSLFPSRYADGRTGPFSFLFPLFRRRRKAAASFSRFAKIEKTIILLFSSPSFFFLPGSRGCLSLFFSFSSWRCIRRGVVRRFPSSLGTKVVCQTPFFFFPPLPLSPPSISSRAGRRRRSVPSFHDRSHLNLIGYKLFPALFFFFSPFLMKFENKFAFFFLSFVL